MVDHEAPAPPISPPPHRAALRPRVEHIWLALPVALLIWVGFRKPLWMLDFWWQLKTGEITVTTGALVRADLFSFTAAGTPDTPHSWLSQCLFYLAYRAGGLPLLVGLNTALLVATLLPIYRLCWEETAGN